MNTQRKQTVFVGLSGGVDSSVSAWLLKEQGFDVQGLFMKNWEEDDSSTFCSAESDLADVKAICKKIHIPLHTVNFSQEYWENVFSFFLDEYKAGRTPNPDILCNKEIKFKAFLQHALKLGADCIATGHYARNIDAMLLRGVDKNKDQSYFLYTLTQEALDKTLFPIGDLEKSRVRQLAKDASLITHDKKDSTGICFIGERKFKTFLEDFLLAKPGVMKTPEGQIIGKHDGLMFYTLGQRQGLHIGGLKGFDEKPWYVVGKDIEHHILYVTQNNSHPWHFSRHLKAHGLHWINELPHNPFRCTAKVRYRQADQHCTVSMTQDDVDVTFDLPQRAVTPGQSVVFYHQDQCLGGGMIQGTDSPGGILQSMIEMPNRELLNA